jgi:hypothetical protein
MGDEQRYDEDQAERRKLTAKKRLKQVSKQQTNAENVAKPAAARGRERSTYSGTGIAAALHRNANRRRRELRY